MTSKFETLTGFMKDKIKAIDKNNKDLTTKNKKSKAIDLAKDTPTYRFLQKLNSTI